MVEDEEHRFIDVGNEIYFYFSFAIGCCCGCCQFDPAGNIDDSTRKLTKFLVAMKHWIALTFIPLTIDFVLGKIEERMKYFFLGNEQRCSFYSGKIKKWMNWDSRNPRETWSWQDESFFVGFDSMRVDLLYNVQNKNHWSHFQLGTRHCNLLKIGEEIFQQLNRNLASRADISEEIFEDTSKRRVPFIIDQTVLLNFCSMIFDDTNEKLKMNFLTSPWFICALVVVDVWDDR